MNRRIHAAGVAATAGGGMLAAAFLQVAVAVAAPDSGSDVGFTVGPLSFDDPVALPGFGLPSTPGYESILPTFWNAPLLSIGSDNALGILNSGFQQFTLEDSSGTTLGTVETHINDQNLLGINTAQFTVDSTDPASGLTASQAAELPADGTVYSITNLGSGFANVYEAVPNTGGTAASSITDTLVTPFGNLNVPTSYDAIAPLNPDAPFAGLGVTPDNSSLSDNAFMIDGTTFDPGSGGFTPLAFNVFSVAPLLSFGAGSLDTSAGGNPVPTQDFEVYNGGVDDGTVHASVMSSDLLGIDSTEFTVAGVTPIIGATGLPAVGTVYSVTDLGTGFANVYEAVPATGTSASIITDTLVTPFGNIDVPTTYDATALVNPAAPLGALAATSSNPDVSDNAFTIDDTTFDPGSAGFGHVGQLFGIAPLLQIAGAQLALPTFVAPFATQGVEAFDGSGTDLGAVNFGENMSNLFGLIDTTQLQVLSVDAASGLTDSQAAELPDVGTIYSVTDFGSGFTNVYEAIPNADGTAASSITDTLMTPFGDFNLPTMFDAIAPLDPGDAAAGVDASGSAAAAGFDLFDPSSWF